jgi:hypothetical protein
VEEKILAPPPSPTHHLPLFSGVRQYLSSQELPSPRYANCIVDGKQTITKEDNEALKPAIVFDDDDVDVDDEWFAVQKEHRLAEKCKVVLNNNGKERKDENIGSGRGGGGGGASYFWTLMSQNGNAQSNLGCSSTECLPYCYSNSKGYPPAVNASLFDQCESESAIPVQNKYKYPEPIDSSAPLLSFDNQPMNQPKVMTSFTDPTSDDLYGSFNWTFELNSDLTVPEKEFSTNKSLGVWSWKYDNHRNKSIVRVYQRVSLLYPWICTYFGVDVVEGVKANQAYDGRGMMLERPTVGTDFIVQFFLNITKVRLNLFIIAFSQLSTCLYFV